MGQHVQKEQNKNVMIEKEQKKIESLDDSFDEKYDDDKDTDFFDAYGMGTTTTDPIYHEKGGGMTHPTVVHSKYESFTKASIINQLQVLNTKAGVGSTNPLENYAVNTWRNLKFLATGALYNLTHIFCWTKKQRKDKLNVVKSMGTALKNFGINAAKTVGGLAISPFAAVYGIGKYVRDKIKKEDIEIQKDSFRHNVCKKTYAYLFGGVVRNLINTTFMAGSLPFWLIGGTINTIRHLVIGDGLQGFKPAFDLPTPMLPVEWEHYYDMHSKLGGITSTFEKEKDETTGKYKSQFTVSKAWENFWKRFKGDFRRFKTANWHSFFTGDMRNVHNVYTDAVDYNNMQQI